MGMNAFDITCGKILVSDPCYSPGTCGTVTIDNVKNGRWHAETHLSDEGSWGKRVSALVATHGQGAVDLDDHRWEVVGNAGVDSGQCGIWDKEAYGLNQGGDFDDERSFYGRVCHGTSVEPQMIATELFGVASSSGFGDGGYEVYAIRVNDECLAVKIVYIGEEEYLDVEDDGDNI
jgi:hypothetical protein